MSTKKRQLTLKGTLKRKAKAAKTEPYDEECDQLEKEIEKLNQELELKQAELLQVEKETFTTVNTPQLLKLKNNEDSKELESLTARKVELQELCRRQKLVLGVDVAEYNESSFTVVYNTQHDEPTPVEYGLKIQTEDDIPAITKYSLPIGFNLNAVVGQYDSIKQTEALTAVWTALVAFHTRQKNYQLLKRRLPYDARTFTVLDRSHVGLRLRVQRADLEERVADLALELDYDVAGVVAENVHIRADMSEEEEAALKKQCAAFSKQPLHRAFGTCFLEQRGLWRCCGTDYDVEEAEAAPEPVVRREKRGRDPRPAYSDDDDWLPEDLPLRRNRK